MPERRMDGADLELAEELRELGRWLQLPAPDVTRAVRARLSTRGSAAQARFRAVPRRWLAAAAAVVVAFAIALVPQGRAAVAHAVTGLLHIAGIEVRHGQPHPAVTPSPLPSLQSVTLDDARRRARFPIGVPDRLGAPAGVQIADPGPDGAPRIVSLLYRGGTVRLDEFDGQPDPMYLKTTVANARWVEVRGQSGLWFPTPHELTYVDRQGVAHTETARMAGPTLVWLGERTTYRLEGLQNFDEALAIALSVH
jgi:hypothetical protein